MGETQSPVDFNGPLAEASVAGLPVVRQYERDAIVPFERLLVKNSSEHTKFPCKHDQMDGLNESQFDPTQNTGVKLTGFHEKMNSQRRMSVASNASRVSKYSFSSFRSKLRRSRSHEAQKIVNDASESSGPQGKNDVTAIKRSSTGRVRGGSMNRNAMEEARQAEEADKLAELLQAKEIAQQERRKAAEAEKELKATTEAFRNLCLKLQKKEEELELQKAKAEKAKENEKILQKDIKDERAAAEKVYKMYVDLAYEVESTKLDISVPNIA